MTVFFCKNGRRQISRRRQNSPYFVWDCQSIRSTFGNTTVIKMFSPNGYTSSCTRQSTCRVSADLGNPTRPAHRPKGRFGRPASSFSDNVGHRLCAISWATPLHMCEFHFDFSRSTANAVVPIKNNSHVLFGSHVAKRQEIWGKLRGRNMGVKVALLRGSKQLQLAWFRRR